MRNQDQVPKCRRMTTSAHACAVTRVMSCLEYANLRILCIIICMQVCAMWHPEMRVHPSGACQSIEGKSLIKADRWGRVCTLCRQSHGAVVRCNLGHCSSAFHPLCARNAGLYLAIRPGAGNSPSVYRIYCSLHSGPQRDKDRAGVDPLPPGVGSLLLVTCRAYLLAALSTCCA